MLDDFEFNAELGAILLIGGRIYLRNAAYTCAAERPSGTALDTAQEMPTPRPPDPFDSLAGCDCPSVHRH